ncbi:MAG TPA: 50S ribosomal protein L23 [Candidatus Nanoarchaeia archaeon]|nr:50S ribosomal protein L23 [Candidatus Nanoarchaeia archaeon]
MFDPYQIVKKILNTEKSVKLMETENKLMLDVDLRATKKDIKLAVENIFNVKVLKVNSFITPECKKKAYVKLNKDKPAIDIITQMGIK